MSPNFENEVNTKAWIAVSQLQNALAEAEFAFNGVQIQKAVSLMLVALVDDVAILILSSLRERFDDEVNAKVREVVIGVFDRVIVKK